MGIEGFSKKTSKYESNRWSHPDSLILRSGKEVDLNTSPEGEIMLHRIRIKLLIERDAQTEPEEAKKLEEHLEVVETALKKRFGITFEKS